MASNVPPGADFDYYDDWQECPDCGGDDHDDAACECEAFEDICCCLIPTPPRCQTCAGKGGWHLDASADDQETFENERDLQ